MKVGAIEWNVREVSRQRISFGACGSDERRRRTWSRHMVDYDINEDSYTSIAAPRDHLFEILLAARSRLNLEGHWLVTLIPRAVFDYHILVHWARLHATVAFRSQEVFALLRDVQPFPFEQMNDALPVADEVRVELANGEVDQSQET